MKLNKDIMDAIEASIRLRLNDVKALCKAYDMNYDLVKSEMISRFGDESTYTKVSRGKSGAIGKAKRSSFVNLYDENRHNLVEDIEFCLKMNYSIAELSMIRQSNYEDLLQKVENCINKVRYIRYNDEPNILIVQNLTLDDIERHPSLQYWCSKFCLTEHDMNRNLEHIFTPLEFVTINNNIFYDRKYSLKKLESLVAAKQKRDAKLKKEKSSLEVSLSSNYSDPRSFTKDSLIADCFSAEEISNMLGISSKQVGSVSRLHSKAYQESIRELHFNRVRSSSELQDLEQMIYEGCLSLDEFCEICYIPSKFKKFISKSGLISSKSIRKGNSSNAARRRNYPYSNLNAVRNVDSNEVIQKVLDDDYSSDDYLSTKLKKLAYVRNYDRAVDNVAKYLKRYSSITGHLDVYPNSEVIDTILYKIAFNDILEYERLGLIKIDEESLKMSANERLVENILKELKVTYVKNCRSKLSGNRELDFFIEDKMIAIEVNPTSSHHSNETERYFSSKPSDYHYSKYVECNSLGIELIQLYDFDLSNADSLKSFLRLKLRPDLLRRVFARRTHVKEISTSTARSFLEKYHRDGYRGATTKLGLFYNDELLSVMTFAKSSNSIAEYEIVRYATINDTTVVGGLSKLVSKFKQSSDCKSLMTFSDNDKGTGDGYSKSGFEFIKETGPRAIYLSNSDPANDIYSSKIAYGYALDNSKALVISDAKSKHINLKDYSEIEPYIETKLSHRTNDGEGYDRLFTSGSKLWLKKFKH